MGACCVTLKDPGDASLVTYPQKLTVNIHKKDFAGRAAGVEVVEMNLTRPESIQARTTVQINTESWRISSCVLPGIDPRGTIKKECQDALFWSQEEGMLIATVFDGHGSNGGAVANFCARFTETYFKDHHNEFPVQLTQESPSLGMKQMLELCHADLVASGIDVTISGSLGDSRALLGSVTTEYGRIEYEAVQISVDQKPNHQQELERITNSGGIVCRLEDDLGEKVGPFRVWTRDHQAGLAMSRSLGDSIVHAVGVTATPIIRNFVLSPRRDRFLVLASDGIWYDLHRDAMSNEAVVQFLDTYCKKAAHNASFAQDPAGVVTEGNTTIAHLLCEEARRKWATIVEEEDVMIDDISCIVLELTNSSMPSSDEDKPGIVPEERLISIATIEELYKMYPTFDAGETTK